jgi:cytochrome c oxidase subunit IV
MTHHDSSHDSHQLGHILPHSIYATVLGVLLVLTIITVVVSAKAGIFHFGNWAIVVAMVIASIKAVLVALFFMHLKYESPVTWLYAAFPIILLFFLIGGTFTDNPFRVDPRSGRPVASSTEGVSQPVDEVTHH